MADDSESELEVVSESESDDGGGGRQPARRRRRRTESAASAAVQAAVRTFVAAHPQPPPASAHSARPRFDRTPLEAERAVRRSWKETGPQWNRGKFSETELRKLRAAVVEWIERNRQPADSDESAFARLWSDRKNSGGHNSGGRHKKAWLEIAPSVPKRTVASCYYAAKRAVEPFKWSRWSAEETAQLRELMELHGGSPNPWTLIAAEFGRHPSAVKDKWRALTQPAKSLASWTPAEDAALLQHTRQHAPWLFHIETLASALERPGEQEYLVPWRLIAAGVGSQDQGNCSGRWYRRVGPALLAQLRRAQPQAAADTATAGGATRERKRDKKDKKRKKKRKRRFLLLPSTAGQAEGEEDDDEDSEESSGSEAARRKGERRERKRRKRERKRERKRQRRAAAAAAAAADSTRREQRETEEEEEEEQEQPQGQQQEQGAQEESEDDEPLGPKLARLRASLRRNPSPKPARNPAAGAQPRQPPGLLVREAAARKRLQGDGLLPLPHATARLLPQAGGRS